VKERQTVVFPISNQGNGGASTVLTAGEGININVAGISVTWSQGDTNAGSTVTTLSDLVTYIDGATNWGSDLTITAANEGYERAVYRVNYSNADGSTGSTSTAGTLFWYLGSSIGAASGTITLGTSSTAADIAEQLATDLNTYATAAGNVPYGAYHDSTKGDFITLYATQSKTGYNDSVMPGQTFPTISFNIDASEGSSTARFGTYATTSNSAALNSDFYLSTTKNVVKGLRVTVVNNTQNMYLNTSVISETAPIAATSSSVIGSTGFVGTASITQAAAEVKATLTSGTDGHHSGNTTYTVPFADVVVGSTGALSQAAAATDRTGWL